MKRLLCVLSLLLFAAPAHAGDWSWRNLGRGYYTRVNAAGLNDGWYYKQASSCSYYCGRSTTSYSYSKYAKISAYYPQQTTVLAPVQYSANWKADLIKALDRAKDNELFIEAVRSSGLRVNNGGLLGGTPDVGAYASAGAYGAGYIKGTTVYQQGYQAPYAEQGGTVYGLASYAPGIGQIDIEGLMQTQARIVERLAQSTSESNYAFSDRIEQVSASQLELAKIREAGNILVESMRAAQQPRSLTHTYEAGAQAGGESPDIDSRPLDGSQGSSRPTAPRGDDDSGESWALSLVRVQAYFDANCVQCHGKTDPKKGLNLSQLSLWKPEQFRKHGPNIIDRLASSDPSYMMPPPKSKGEGPNEFESRALLAIFPRKEEL